MAGVSMVVLGPDAALDPLGVIAGLTGAASMGTGVVLTKKWGRPKYVSAVGLAGWQLTAAGLLLAIPASPSTASPSTSVQARGPGTPGSA